MTFAFFFPFLFHFLSANFLSRIPFELLILQRILLSIMALLDSKAQFSARAREIGRSTPCVNSLQVHGIDSLNSMAFAVGTTPGECSSQDFQQFILDKNIVLEGSDEFLVKRLIFEAQTLFMTTIQSQVLSAGLPGGSDSTTQEASTG